MRRQTGQGIVLGVTALLLMTFILVCFVSITMFIGNYIHSTNQLTFAAQQAALYGWNQTYYAGCPKLNSAATVLANTKAAMQPVLANLGFPNASVNFSIVTTNGVNYGQATITASTVPMLGGGVSVLGSALPKTLTITQTALTLGAVPPFIADIAACGGANNVSGCVQVPCVAAAQPYNSGNPSYFPGGLGTIAASDTGGPGYVFFEITPIILQCAVARKPYSTGGAWAY